MFTCYHYWALCGSYISAQLRFWRNKWAFSSLKLTRLGNRSLQGSIDRVQKRDHNSLGIDLVILRSGEILLVHFLKKWGWLSRAMFGSQIQHCVYSSSYHVACQSTICQTAAEVPTFSITHLRLLSFVSREVFSYSILFLQVTLFSEFICLHTECSISRCHVLINSENLLASKIGAK